jgi:hypothetical protein
MAVYIFVITTDGEIRLGNYITHHHPDLVDGANVYGAGQISIDQQGKIIAITDTSGHYFPMGESRNFATEYFPYLKNLLREKGIDVTDDVFKPLVSPQ